MCKNLLFCLYGIFALFFLSTLCDAWRSPIHHPEDTLTDEAFQQHAQKCPSSKHVVQLEADWPLFCGLKKRVFLGSAVCTGKNDTEFLTVAHTIAPWCDKQGTLKYPLYIIFAEHRVPVTFLRMHPQYFSGSQERLFYNIAYFRIASPVTGLTGIEPTYIYPSNLINLPLTTVGFGTNGGKNALFGRNDGKLRAVSTTFNNIIAIAVTPEILDFPISHFGFTQFPYSKKPTFIPLLPFQGGMHRGMEGGGAFLEDGRFVAIPSRFAAVRGLPFFRSLLSRIKSRCSRVVIFLSSLGLPMAGTHTAIGESNVYIPLGHPLLDLHRWIENLRVQHP